MELYIIRHADPDYEHDTITDFGEKEAEQLASRMKALKIDEIYTSPMGRARKTANYTCQALEKSYTVETWAHEVDLHITMPESQNLVWISDLGAHVMRSSKNIKLGDQWHQAEDFTDFGGQKVADFVRLESDQFLSRLGYDREQYFYRVTAENQHRVAFFCHGGLSITWLAHLLGIPYLMAWASFSMHTTGVTKVVFDGRKNAAVAPVCHYYSDVSHLYAAGLLDDSPTAEKGFRV